MGHVYRERCEIRRPAFALLNHCDGRVYVINGGNLNDRTTIGWATNDEYFHPNDSFRLLYPDEWEAAFHKYNDPKCYELKVGMYGLALSVGYSSGLYPVLVQAYDGLYADDIMDYAMYSILQRSDVSQLYSERMRDEVLFSETVHSDSYWSTLFKDKLTESQHFTFRELWLKARIAKGVRRVWICIDGSNNDCQVKDSDLSECGEGKSHSGKPIVGFIYAVDAETGEPITYFVNPGGTVDSQALHEISNFLVGYNLEVEGVILDKGFCTFEDLMTIKGLGSKYIIMVPAGTKGHKTMVDLFGQRIFWNSEYVVDHVRTKSVFGICGEVEIWSSHPGVTGFLNLYFGGIRGAFESGRASYRERV